MLYLKIIKIIIILEMNVIFKDNNYFGDIIECYRL